VLAAGSIESRCKRGYSASRCLAASDLGDRFWGALPAMRGRAPDRRREPANSAAVRRGRYIDALGDLLGGRDPAGGEDLQKLPEEEAEENVALEALVGSETYLSR
jgi:hypothetical protein